MLSRCACPEGDGTFLVAVLPSSAWCIGNFGPLQAYLPQLYCGNVSGSAIPVEDSSQSISPSVTHSESSHPHARTIGKVPFCPTSVPSTPAAVFGSMWTDDGSIAGEGSIVLG